MNLPLFRKGLVLSCILPAVGLAVSCVKINEELGKEFIPTNHQYDVFVAEFPLKNIKMELADSLSGYSSEKFVIGSVMDGTFGITTRSTAFTLIPIVSGTSLDFGDDPVPTQFHFTAVKDTVSLPHSNQEQIIQNINVYALTDEIGDDAIYVSSEDALDVERSRRITNGIPLYTGGDSLSFDFSTEFAELYIEKLSGMTIDSISTYVKELPGIYITTDDRTTPGGRINLFDLTLEVADSYYISGNYAELKFTSTYNGEKVDTSFLFFFGAQDFEPYQETEVSSYYTSTSATTQFALNLTSHQSVSGSLLPETAGEILYVESGGGVKPVFSAKEIRDSCISIFEKQGIDPQAVVINKALLVLPYEFPMYDEGIDRFPARLSPTMRLRGTLDDGTKYVSFAGLTDSSVDTEDPGDINRSLSRYTPDIGHHLQEVLRRTEDSDEDLSQYDIWLLIMSEEVVESSSSSSMNDYYSNLMYYSYLNSLYNGYGYGSYGYGYGGYGSSYYGYSNYINYALAAQYSSSQSSTETSYQLDRDRYYYGTLNGPDATVGDVPKIQITYSVARTATN